MPASWFPIEAGHVLLFRRSTGECLERLPPDGSIPLTFVQAASHFDPDYAHRFRNGKPWHGLGGFEPPPSTEHGTGLHAEQHFEFHQPIAIGDVLSASIRDGDTWTKEGRRAGTLVFKEVITDFHNEHGVLVLTSRAVGVRTERPVDADQ